MHLHEYQAKQSLAQYGIPVPIGVVVHEFDQVSAALRKLGGESWVIKAQIHAGGRGKAGGVKVVRSMEEAHEVASKLLGHRLVTHQTDARGQMVSALLIEPPCAIRKELYLSLFMDRGSCAPVVLASSEGGMDIERIAKERPEKLFKQVLHPVTGVLPFHGRVLAKQLGLQGPAWKAFPDLLLKLGKFFLEKDLTLLEINPLIVTQSGQLLCLDAKVQVDDNALYRHQPLQGYYDETQEDPQELKAHQHQLSYVALDGNIGCLVNGAGLAMATMDLIQLYGGKPANFLDVGGTATQDRVMEAFKIIMENPQVEAILVNIFGGIVRCDLIAEGIQRAVELMRLTVPVVVRLEGNQSQKALEMLQKAGERNPSLRLVPAKGLAEAAQKVMAYAAGHGL